jgi:hypothetical protein
MAAIPLKKGGNPIFVPKNPRGCSQNLKILVLSGVTAISHFGPININKCLEALILDTGFRCLLAINGRNFRVNAHLAVNPTPPVEGA